MYRGLSFQVSGQMRFRMSLHGLLQHRARDPAALKLTASQQAQVGGEGMPPVTPRRWPCPGARQAQGWRWCGVRGTPLAFAVQTGGWRKPSKPSRKLFSCPEVQSPCGSRHRGGGDVGEAGRAPRPPCKPRSYKMHFPAYPSGLSEPLLLAALFIHDRQLINIQAS